MQRNSHLVLAAGIAGAVFATFLSHAWSEPAIASSGLYGADIKVATVDVLKLLERMLDGEPYASERESNTKTWNDQISDLASQRDALVQSLSQMKPDDANAQALYEQYQGLQQRINGLSQEAGAAVDKLSAQQLADAYKHIHAAVQKVAEAGGYDRVFSSRMTTEDINADNTNVIVQEVLLRPVLRNAGGDDLTPQIMEELGIKEAEPQKPDAAPTEPGATGPAPAEPVPGGGK
ncbi:MAG: OmpH family outer membrane protein [Phycisphaerales bacterium]|nr:OmpH family outer membrane protein [Phycisphaerales bacterium]